MLNTLCAEDFIPLINKRCRLTAEPDFEFDLVVDSVEESPRFKRPQDIRSPFSVLLKGALEPHFMSGLFEMELETGLKLHQVGINRITPPWGLDSDSAYYQMVFN